MDTDPSLLSLNVGLGVLLVDLLLSGDNAIVIALVCRSLSKEHRSKALWLGVLGAFLARLVLTSVATLAMNLPLLKLVGGIMLMKIAVDLLVDNTGPNGLPVDSDSGSDDIFAAAKTIVLADIVMSLDNVVALSAITQNNFQMLLLGLLLSVPILMFGSLYVGRLMELFPRLVWLGGAVLGGVAGALIIDDPVFGGAFNNASSTAALFVPVLAAVFTVQISRVMTSNAQSVAALQKPRALFDILRGSPQAKEILRLPEPVPAMSVPAAATVVAAEPMVQRVAPPPKPPAPRVAAQPRADHRVVMALGAFMMLTGGLAYYLINVFQPPVPDDFSTYVCKEPALSIRYKPGANQIRFTSNKGVVSTTVIEDRVVWEDYRDSGSRLGVPPPVKIVMADTAKLVVNGGMFENTSCLMVAQQ